jgi:MYXO-CTERM domain-containing protein
MTIRILGVATLAACVSMNAHATMVASDNGSNYSGGWTSGSNGGFGFGAWSFSTYGGGQREPYYNNFTITGVPAPGAMALMGVAGLVAGRRRRA